MGGEVGAAAESPARGKVFTAPAVWVDPDDGATWTFVADVAGIAAWIVEVDAAGTPRLARKWESDEGATSPIIANDVLYCAASGSLRALDPRSGEELWRSAEIGEIHWQSPIVAQGALYITDEGGHLFAYALP